jgi:putative ABC transport system ATP-binding protein
VTALLELHDVGKSVGTDRPRTLFEGLSLEVQAGESVALVGESGTGKSTLLNLMAGLDRVDRGVVRLDGVDLATLGDDALAALRRRRIGFVFQAFHLLPQLTLLQNVALPLQLLEVPRGEWRARALAMLDAVGLGARADDPVQMLSGGESQRVAVARALVHRPALVLADEPTGNLDSDAADGVLALLRTQVKAQGAACVLVTHSMRAAGSADRVQRLTAQGVAPDAAAGPAAAPVGDAAAGSGPV